MPEARPVQHQAEGGPYRSHIPALDGVRGLAIVLVMGSHLFPGTPHNGVERAVEDLLGFGASGVDLFFVLSGFLITGILFDSRQERHFFRTFYARRALRIFPLYYGVLAVFAIVAGLRHVSSGGELTSLSLYLQNTDLVAAPIWRYHSSLTLPLGHFWSLAVEEQFYLAWPLLVFFLQRRGRLLAVCAASLLLCPLLRFAFWVRGAEYNIVHAGTLFRADALLAGGALALLLRSRYHDRVLAAARWFAIALVPVLALHCVHSTAWTAEGAKNLPALLALTLVYSLLALGFAGLVGWSLMAGSVVQKAFQVRGLRMLGRYSYGLYVLHLILFFYGIAPLRAGMQRLHVPASLTGPFSGLAMALLSMVAAVASYQLYEKRFLALKRLFPYGAETWRAERTRSPRPHSSNDLGRVASLPGEISVSPHRS